MPSQDDDRRPGSEREGTERTSFRHLGGDWMADVLEEARQRGDFDDLPGKGKPLNLSDPDPYGGPEAEVYKILKNAGFTPEWIELRRKITDELHWLKTAGKHPERPSRIVEVNTLIDKHNRLIPNPSLAFPKVPRDFGLTPA